MYQYNQKYPPMGPPPLGPPQGPQQQQQQQLAQTQLAQYPMPTRKRMSKYRFMIYVLVIGNMVAVVGMFIAAFWGFTYPTIMIDGYESGKSAYVAAFMCFLSAICLCGLNFQNYYLLVTYAILNVVVMLNEVFSLLPFTWTRIPNYPITGNIDTQVYITLPIKIMMVVMAFSLAYKLRRDEKRFELANAGGGLHQRLPCHIVPRPDGPNAGGPPPRMAPGGGAGGGANTGAGMLNRSMYGQPQNDAGGGGGGGSYGLNGQGPMAGGSPPNLPPMRSTGGNMPPTMSSTGTNAGGMPGGGVVSGGGGAPSSLNQIVNTPPIYPLHRPSVTDVTHHSLASPNRPGASVGTTASGGSYRPSSSAVGSLPAPPPPPPPSSVMSMAAAMGNHSSSCGGNLNSISMLNEQDNLVRTRSSGFQWIGGGAGGQGSVGGGGGRFPYEAVPTNNNNNAYGCIPSQQQQQQQQQQAKQWWQSTAKQQQYASYYRDVYNPNF